MKKFETISRILHSTKRQLPENIWNRHQTKVPFYLLF